MRKVVMILVLLNIGQQIKLNAQVPNWVWAKQGVCHVSSGSLGYNITTDSLGNAYLCGSFSDSIRFGALTLFGGTQSPFLVKYNSTGNVIWAKGANGNTTNCYMYRVTTDAFGNIYATGYFTDSALTFDSFTILRTSGCMFIVKYNSSGNVIWAKSQGGAQSVSIYESDITTDVSGNIIIGGYFQNTTISFGSYIFPNMGFVDAFIVKYNSSGNVLWAKHMGDSNYEDGRGVTTDKLGNVYFSGNYADNSLTLGSITLINNYPPYADIFLVKYDSLGNEIWAKDFGGDYDDIPYSIAVNSYGKIFMTGNFQSHSINFGSTTLSNPPVFSYCNVFIVEFDLNGNKIWAKQSSGYHSAPTPIPTTGYCAKADAIGNVYISGGNWDDNYNGAFVFDSISLPLQSGQDPMFVVKYDSLGNPLWAKELNSGGYVLPSIALGNNDDIYVGGTFVDSTTMTEPFFPVGSDTLNPYGPFNPFIAKIGTLNTSGVPFILKQNFEIQIYPNPTTTSFTISTTGGKIKELKVVNVLGEIVYKTALSTTQETINVSQLTKGIYFVQLLDENKNVVNRKVVIQ